MLEIINHQMRLKLIIFIYHIKLFIEECVNYYWLYVNKGTKADISLGLP